MTCATDAAVVRTDCAGSPPPAAQPGVKSSRSSTCPTLGSCPPTRAGIVVSPLSQSRSETSQADATTAPGLHKPVERPSRKGDVALAWRDLPTEGGHALTRR